MCENFINTILNDCGPWLNVYLGYTRNCWFDELLYFGQLFTQLSFQKFQQFNKFEALNRCKPELSSSKKKHGNSSFSMTS